VAFPRPLPLVSNPQPFDHPDWLYEIKHDGFRAFAIVEGTLQARLASRPCVHEVGLLCGEIGHSIRCRDAVRRRVSCASTSMAAATSIGGATRRPSTRSMWWRSMGRISATGRSSRASASCAA